MLRPQGQVPLSNSKRSARAEKCAWLVLWVAAAGALCAAQQMNLGPHDVAGRGCLSCHAPTTDPLAPAAWAPDASNVTGFSQPEPDDAFSHTYRCLSCHDGNLAQIMDLSLAGPAARPRISGPHPVNMRYDTHSDEFFPVERVEGEWRLLNNPENPLTRLKLFPRNSSDPTPTVQCTTCHDPHEYGNGFFLRDAYDRYETGTRFCRTCHMEESNYQFATLR